MLVLIDIFINYQISIERNIDIERQTSNLYFNHIMLLLKSFISGILFLFKSFFYIEFTFIYEVIVIFTNKFFYFWQI